MKRTITAEASAPPDPNGRSWLDDLHDREAAGLPVKPEIVTYMRYGMILRYWDGTITLRGPQQEAVAPWYTLVPEWPAKALAFGALPGSGAARTSGVTVTKGVFYGLVPTNTVSIHFTDGTSITLPALCAGKYVS